MGGDYILGELLMPGGSLAVQQGLDLRVAAQNPLHSMREGGVAQIVEQASQPDLADIISRELQVLGHPPCHMHGS